MTIAISRRIRLAVNDWVIGEVQGEIFRSQGHVVRIMNLPTLTSEEIVDFSPDLVVVDTYPCSDDARRVTDELPSSLPIFGVQVVGISTVEETGEEASRADAGQRLGHDDLRWET